MNNVETTVDDLNVGKFKTVHVDLEKVSDVVDKEVVKKYKTQHTKDKSK